jgi:phosphohistidine phosphatase SixA
MKRLFVIRNAHSAVGAIDRERELDDLGLLELQSIGSQMVAAGLRPNLILTSSIRRSVDTAKHIRELFGLLANVIDIREDLYHANLDQTLKILQSLPESKDSIMFISNLQSILELLNGLTSSEYQTIPNAGLIILELRTRHWKDLSLHASREILSINPSISS